MINKYTITIAVLAVILLVIFAPDWSGERGNSFMEESITREGGLITHQEFNPKKPLLLDKPIVVDVPPDSVVGVTPTSFSIRAIAPVFQRATQQEPCRVKQGLLQLRT